MASNEFDKILVRDFSNIVAKIAKGMAALIGKDVMYR